MANLSFLFVNDLETAIKAMDKGNATKLVRAMADRQMTIPFALITKFCDLLESKGMAGNKRKISYFCLLEDDKWHEIMTELEKYREALPYGSKGKALENIARKYNMSVKALEAWHTDWKKASAINDEIDREMLEEEYNQRNPARQE